MKTKAIIPLLVLLMSLSASAQYHNDYYHITGDTVYGRTEIGYYKWWEMNELLHDGHFYTIEGVSHKSYGVHITPYFTPAPLKIVGIAGLPSSNSSRFGPVDTTAYPEYFYLYDKGPNGPLFRKQVQWDLRAPHRRFYFEYAPQLIYSDSCCRFDILCMYGHLYECYFDTAVSVSDTFYVGWSNNSNFFTFNPMDSTPRPIPTTTYYTHIQPFLVQNPCSEIDTVFHNEGDIALHNNGGICYFPIFDYMKCEDTVLSSNPAAPVQWTPFQSRNFVMVYPLFQVDTTVPPRTFCDPVQNVQVATDGDSCATVTWDDFYHYTYCDVQYFSTDQGLVNATTQTVYGNMLHLCGLEAGKSYFVRVRAFCDTSKIQTEWSQWVSFTTAGGSASIDGGTTMLSRYTLVSPNPADSKVTVTSSFGLSRIEVYNMRGILVYDQPAGHSSATVIDLDGWVPGQYVMLVHTPQGVTAKRLTVTR